MGRRYLLNIRWKDLSGAPVEKFARRESSVGAPDRSRVPPIIEKIPVIGIIGYSIFMVVSITQGRAENC